MMPLTKYEIPEALEAEWLSTAVADFELNLGCDLGYNEETREFSGKLKSIAVRTLAQMMYVSYLQRELSRVMALNGIYGKDVQLTGQDATKRGAMRSIRKLCLLLRLLPLLVAMIMRLNIKQELLPTLFPHLCQQRLARLLRI